MQPRRKDGRGRLDRGTWFACSPRSLSPLGWMLREGGGTTAATPGRTKAEDVRPGALLAVGRWVVDFLRSTYNQATTESSRE